MKLFYWHNKNNFGDMLSPEVIECVTGIRPERARRNDRGKLLGIGSILGVMQPGDVVWGSGWHRNKRERLVVPEGVLLLLLRGPLSAADLGVTGVRYGDPGLLVTRLVKRGAPRKKLWVPHFVDDENQCPDGFEYVNIRAPWREVAEAIASADRVATSSLHAMIVAEAFGAVVKWQQCSKVIGGRFKFEDYLLSTGRPTETLRHNAWLPPGDTWSLLDNIYATVTRLKELLCENSGT